MVNMNSPVGGFTHPGYYSRIIPPSTLTIVAPSLGITTGAPEEQGGNGLLLIGAAVVLGLSIAALTMN